MCSHLSWQIALGPIRMIKAVKFCNTIGLLLYHLLAISHQDKVLGYHQQQILQCLTPTRYLLCSDLMVVQSRSLGKAFSIYNWLGILCVTPVHFCLPLQQLRLLCTHLRYRRDPDLLIVLSTTEK